MEKVKYIDVHSDKYGDFKVIVDEEDYDWLNSYHWNIRRKYSQVIESYYAGTSIDGKVSLIHRMITGCPNGMVVDHINGDSLDNRKCNLRICEPSENAKNRSDNSNNKSGRKGVFWYTYCKTPRWVAKITVDYKIIHLGSFKNFDDACKARDDAEEKYFGEYNRL